MTIEAADLTPRMQRATTLALAARNRLLAIRPLYVLSALLGLQWFFVFVLALVVRHNGWVYYMGGDQLWHYTSAYLIGHGKLPPTYVGIGWPTILAPIAWLAGPNLLSALPAIILFNAFVLLPLGLVCMYGIGARIAGRLFGYWTALLWIVIPFVGIPYALRGYHQKWTELTLPQLVGLGAMSDYPSMIALVVGAYVCLRAVDERHWSWAAAAGLIVGYALAMKPSNSVFLVAPALLFVLWRPRALLPFIVGLVPCLAALGFWKVRGEGILPWRSSAPPQRVAAGPGFFHRYLGTNSWAQFHNNLLAIREHLWSDRLLEFIVIAGIVALLLRSRRAAVFVGTWFALFLILKGTYVNASVENATFWRLLMPAFPAFVVLAAAIPLLLPGLRVRTETPTPWRLPRRLTIAVFAVLVLVLSLFPIALVAATKPVRAPKPSAFEVNGILVSESPALQLHAQPSNGVVKVSWTRPTSRQGNVSYSLFRRAGPVDVFCGPVRNAPDLCNLGAQEIVATRSGTFLDRPGPGIWTYRVGITTNWLDDPALGDVYVISHPDTVTVQS